MCEVQSSFAVSPTLTISGSSRTSKTSSSDGETCSDATSLKSAASSKFVCSRSRATPASTAPPVEFRDGSRDSTTRPTPTLTLKTPTSPASSVDINGTTFPLKISTLTTSLSSGFPYDESLFNINVSPAKWARFSHEVVQATKLTAKDWTAIAAGYSIAVTGLVGMSLFVGHKVTRKVQRNRVRTSLACAHEGRLGAVLARWNEGYFSRLGVAAEVWLSEDVAQSEGAVESRCTAGWWEELERAKKQLRKMPLVAVDKETRQQFQDERKYMIVLIPVSAVPGKLELEAPRVDGAVEFEGDCTTAELPTQEAERLELPTQVQNAVELDSTPIELPPPAYDSDEKAVMNRAVTSNDLNRAMWSSDVQCASLGVA